MDENRDLLSNELRITMEDGNPDAGISVAEDGIQVFSGKAFSDYDLYRKSAETDIELVTIAGPSGSGKMTLGLMMYYFFAEGHNENIQFVSSDTLMGYRERSKPLLYNSGKQEPRVDRTLAAEGRRFYHLKV